MLEDILTASMNKLVNRSSKGFSKDVMDGIIQACLVSPYLALKKLWTEASKHGGYEKVICEVKSKFLQQNFVSGLCELSEKGISNVEVQCR